ncbi:MAG: hypothetical protein LYZ69_05805 [Nitrososphaerales archaeon]|nr:hypothetical protein [Nitrososphaerales archaeon]
MEKPPAIDLGSVVALCPASKEAPSFAAPFFLYAFARSTAERAPRL